MSRILITLATLMLAGCASGISHDMSASEAKAKFAKDYNSGRFKDVIADEDMMRKAGALDAQFQLVLAQAYFKVQDYGGCVKYAKPINSDDARELEARCIYEISHRPQP